MSFDMAARERATRHAYYGVAWTVILVLTIWGFGPVFFFRTDPSLGKLSPLLLLHGIVMSTWLAVFLIQTRLVALGRANWHRRFGVFGAFVGVCVIAVTLAAARRAAHYGEGPPGVPTNLFVLASLFAVAAFALLFGAAIVLRRRPDWHQRLMLLATMTLLGAAVARLPYERFPAFAFLQSGGPLGLFTIDLLVIYACIAWDTFRNRRLHPAFGWGLAGFLFLNNVLVNFLAGSSAWNAFFRLIAS